MPHRCIYGHGYDSTDAVEELCTTIQGMGALQFHPQKSIFTIMERALFHMGEPLASLNRSIHSPGQSGAPWVQPIS